MRYATLTNANPNDCRTRMAGEIAGNSRPSIAGTSAGAATRVRVFTLGRFGMEIDDEALVSRGKAKHRPLGLLKALIALGGRDVASSRLCECLWPDSEADLAARNLTITVHRLRSLLGIPAAVVQHDGKLTLDEKYCWVDVWNFERMASEGLRSYDESVADSGPEARLRAALGLYTGDFLCRESDESWMLVPRLRLKTKFERLVCALSALLERQKRYADAIDLCLQALELDPLDELLYRRLMNCYLKQGEFAGAMRTYLRCREALAKGLAAPISSETERLYLDAAHAAAERGITPMTKTAPVLMAHSQSLQRRLV